MTSAILPERRTRSQLTLPDNILQIPLRSPLKDARTAMRNHTIANDAMSADDSEDELLLSPRKKEPQMRVASSSKRSASPPLQDEYTGTTPPEARALKRVKHDSPVGETQSDIENVKTDIRLHKRLGQTHSRTHSDPNIQPGRRSARKRSATPGKPFSTVSASPPPSLFSPGATSPRKERAKSVPLFPSTNDIPHIDFRNPPPSPKRNRSPSRSPSKGRTPKLRITSKTFAVSQTLPTIRDELTSKMDIDEDASSVLEEAEMPQISVSPNPHVAEAEVGEPIPARPTLTTSTSQTMLPIIPATPATQSLNRLIPMSPLTPLPPTPLQARILSADDAKERYNSDIGWGAAPLKDMVSSSEVTNPPAAPAPMKSRLPRPSLAPPPSKGSRTTTMGPPTTTTLKKPMMAAQGPATTGQEAPAPKKDIFAVMMKEAQRPQTLEKGKGKVKAKTIKPPPAPANFFKTTEKDYAGPSTKTKPSLKDKMRRAEKTQQKLPQFVPLPEDEEEDYPKPSRSPWSEPEAKMEETRQYSPTKPEVDAQSKRASPESLEPTSAVEDPVMGSAKEDHNVASTPAFASPDTPMVDAEIHGQIQSDEPQSAAPESSQEPLLAVADDVSTETGANALESGELVGENAAGVVETREPSTAEPTSRTSRASKLPLGKKRQPISVQPAARVTRSSSNSKKIGELSGSTVGLSRSKSMTMGHLPAKRTASGTVKEAALPEETPLAESETAAEAALPPGSPMKVSSPIRASDKGSPMKKDDAKVVQISPGKSSLAKTPTKSNFSAQKPASSPSPSKIARSSSYMSMRPPAPGMVRTFSVDKSLVRSGANSSLSTLSNALEKLRMPPPSRPSTSMGFNRDLSGDEEEPDVLTRTQDDGKVGRVSLGLGRADGGLKRAATLGAGAFKVPTTSVTASSTTGNQPVQKTLTMFMSHKGSGTHKAGAGPILHATGRLGVGNNTKPSIFGGTGGIRRTISKRTPLPMVLGSPVKGGESADETMVDDNNADEDAKANVTEEPDNNFMAPVNASTATILAEDSTPTEGSGKGKQKETNPFSQSLSAIPMAKPPAKGLMGPPPTPPSVGNISNRSTGSNASGASSASPSQAGPFGATRSSARIAKSAPTLAKTKSGTDGHASSSKGADATSPVPKTQKILDGCVIFVDVKTEAGDEAGSVFVTMLEDLGARVQGRVGQSCTHIVYKNGLAGTLTKYRLLRDPKPLVVGIGWVVECAEQQKRVEEAEFLVDLENAHFAGTHKRRRSMLPKMYSSSIPLPSGLDKDQSGDGDRSIDDASTSISLDEDLTPLERVRRRQSILTGPRP